MFNAKILLILILTSAAAIGSVLVAAEHLPAWLSTVVKTGPNKGIAPVAALPALAVGYVLVFRMTGARMRSGRR